VSIKLARRFSCCLPFQNEYLTEKWYSVSETTLERIQVVCTLLRDIKVVLATYLLLRFPKNQWLETGTKFLASGQGVPSDLDWKGP